MSGRSRVGAALVLLVVPAVAFTGCATAADAHADNLNLAENSVRRLIPEFEEFLSGYLSVSRSGAEALEIVQASLPAPTPLPTRLIKESQTDATQIRLSMIFYSTVRGETYNYNGTDTAEICADFTGTAGEPASVISVQVTCPAVPPEGGLRAEQVDSILSP